MENNWLKNLAKKIEHRNVALVGIILGGLCLCYKGLDILKAINTEPSNDNDVTGNTPLTIADYTEVEEGLDSDIDDYDFA